MLPPVLSFLFFGKDDLILARSFKFSIFHFFSQKYANCCILWFFHYLLCHVKKKIHSPFEDTSNEYFFWTTVRDEFWIKIIRTIGWTSLTLTHIFHHSSHLIPLHSIMLQNKVETTILEVLPQDMGAYRCMKTSQHYQLHQ